MAPTRYDEHADGWVRSQQTEDEAREWARHYGDNDSWYWSAKSQAMTSITDGVTTVQDVADALARGDDSPEIARLAADYWLMVGRHVQGAAAAVGEASRSWLTGTKPDGDGYYPEPSPAPTATIEAAERGYSAATAIVEDLQDASRAAWSAETDAQKAAEAAERLDADLITAREAAADRADPDISGDAWGAELAARAEGGHYTDGQSAAQRDAERGYADAWQAANPDAAGDAAGLTGIDSHDRMVASHHADQGYTVRPGENPWNRPRELDLPYSPPVSSPPEHEGKSADEVLAELLDDLDQARAQLESGDARGDDKHDLAGRIEQLEEGVAAQRERAPRGSGAARQDDHQAERDLAIAEILHEALYDDGPPIPPDQAAEFAAYAEMWAQEALADYDRDLEERTEADQSAQSKTHQYPVEDASGDEPGQAHAADAVAAARDAVQADTHRVAADQAQRQAQTHPARGADADQQPARGHGGDGHE